MENTKGKLPHYLGKLFYAVAIADKKIEDKEVAVFKTEIFNRWSNPDSIKNNLTTGAHHEIIKTFNELQLLSAESNFCYSEFNAFYLGHKTLFNPQLRKLIWETAQAIAMSFANKNKSELILLAKLKMLLQN
jgi:hypothetical protein